MSTITVGSGLGGFTAIAPQSEYGGTFTTPNRTIPGLKSNKATHDPHIVQGTDYLEYGRIVDIGAAHVQTYLDAKGTLVCDAFQSGLALLLATAFGSAAQLYPGVQGQYELGGTVGPQIEAPESHNGQVWSAANTYLNTGEFVFEGSTWYENLKGDTTNINQKPSAEGSYWKKLTNWASGTSYTAGQLAPFTPTGGKSAIYKCILSAKGVLQSPENGNYWTAITGQSGCCFDMQLGVPTTTGELTPWNYHSCMITKAEFVFERTGLVSCTFDWDAQYVESTTALIVPTPSTAYAPFSMSNTASVFKIGAPGAQQTLPGVKKATVTIQRKLAVNRIYLGETHKQVPSTNGMVDLMVACEMDYTSQAKSVLETFLTNTAQALTIQAVGAAIGTVQNELGFTMTNGFIESGGEAPLDGADVVKNTVNLKATINTTNEPPLKAKLVTADSTF